MQLIIQLDPVAGEGSGSWAGGFDLSHGLVTGSLGKGFHSWLRGLVEQGSRIFRKWHSFLLVFTINLITRDEIYSYIYVCYSYIYIYMYDMQCTPSKTNMAMENHHF